MGNGARPSDAVGEAVTPNKDALGRSKNDVPPNKSDADDDKAAAAAAEEAEEEVDTAACEAPDGDR